MSDIIYDSVSEVLLLRRILTVLFQIGIIIAFTWAGKWIALLLPIPVPGSVIGMALLFTALHQGLIHLNWVQAGATLLISEMLLFFIPAVVGFMQYTWMFGVKGISVLFIVISGTALMMITTAIISEKILERESGEARKWLPRLFM